MRTTTVIVIVLATIACAPLLVSAEEVVEDPALHVQYEGQCLIVEETHTPPVYLEPC